MTKPPEPALPSPERPRHADGPRGLRALPDLSYNTHSALVLALTFLAYMLYHASRKPPSIVKRELARSWPPFSDPALLGATDVAFLTSYSLGMFVAGHLGDRLDLRRFLAFGMVASGASVALFGLGYFLGLHSLAFYVVAQVITGLLQTTGWPSVVAIVGNWFSGRRRGLIMGIWNAHTSVGNITGSLVAAAMLGYGWGWSFAVPGGLIALGGVLVLFFLEPYPQYVGFGPSPIEPVNEESTDEEDSSTAGGAGKDRRDAVGILKALSIPGVVIFALCLFFAKLVAYTFLYWLPFYLGQTAIGGEYMSAASAGCLSVLFDVGGIVGGILAGFISDQLNARATTVAIFMYLAIPSLFLFHAYGSTSKVTNIGLMMICGLLVNGPYALITTAVSADLGTHKSLKGDSRALATVTAIIDGAGSLGAALGPFITGFISKKGWDTVFVMLALCAFVAAVLLSSNVKREIPQIIQNWRNCSTNTLSGNADSGVQPLLVEDS
ncbi:putative glycerol-3-phosphate transporter 4 isoform X2 [Phragmites australis]|uniref:putative glycerol-3-phosphate transporter 4 isoform X2 n=1 Tax=Phragmites australis TaxID=29695 RepID=UPI002D779451|nr:putative glycerol-3-phosphate transporter 4 isoform X2 [Phragmites australis]